MKIIKFDELFVQNFLSVGTNGVKLDFTTGITVVAGENLDVPDSNNGCGKSALINALFWVIFGETISDLKNKNIRNRKTKEECFGILKFWVNNDEYTIKRSLDPSLVDIFRGSEKITLSTIDKNNEFIKNLLGVNQEVFKSSVILTLDNTISFMKLGKTVKRKFIEGVLNLGVFGDMLLRVRKDYNDKKKESDVNVSVFENENSNLERLKQQKITNAERKQQKIDALNAKILENDKRISTLNDENNNVNTETSKIQKILSNLHSDQKKILDDDLIDSYTEEITKLSNQVAVIESSVSTKKSELKKLKESTGACPTCKRPYSTEKCDTEAHIKTLVDDIIKLEEDRLQVLKNHDDKKTDRHELKTKLTKIQSDIYNYSEKISKLNAITTEIDNIRQKNLEISAYIKEMIDEKDSIDDLIQKSIEKIDSVKILIKECHKSLAILDAAKLIVAEDGAKTVTIKKILKFLNDRLAYYLSNFNAPCTITFDSSFDSEILSNDGKEIDYSNLSGGERGRVDASISFMFQDVLKMYNGISFNVSMYDEWADKALDRVGLEKFSDVLRKRVNDDSHCIYLVTHNPNLLKFDFDNLLTMIKKDGITTIKN